VAISLKESVCTAHNITADTAILAGRIQWLTGQEREVAEAILLRGQTAASVARLMGLSPRTVRDRLRRIVRRLAGRRFRMTIRAIPYLAPAEAKLAAVRFCQGRTLRQTAEEMGLGFHAARRQCDAVWAQVQAIERMRKARPAGEVFEAMARGRRRRSA